MQILTAKVTYLLQRGNVEVVTAVHLRLPWATEGRFMEERIVMGVDHECKSGSSATVHGVARRRQIPTRGDGPANSEKMGSNKTRAGSSCEPVATRGNLTMKLWMHVSKI